MMKFLHNKMAFVVVMIAVAMTASTISFAQTYSWIPLGSVAAMWAANGTHAYNSNAGSIVIGGNLPDGSLLLDVAGQIGGSEYCDAAGANCFAATDIQWRAEGTHAHSINSGNVGIGVATSSSPAEKLEVNGNVLADAYFYVSDGRLKTNIQPLSGLDIIGRLRGVSFDWLETGEPAVGLIAQEVETVLPELVATDQTGRKSVQYANLVAPLIQAVNEQQLQIEELQREVERLKQ